MYRITFYSIPFMRGGLNAPAFPAGKDPATVLTSYKVAEYVTARPFAETQDTLIIPDGLTVADSTANYVRVALCASETAPIEEDRAPSYYWAENIDMLGEQADGTVPVRVEIVPDPWGTDFFPSNAKVNGRIAQTTKALQIPQSVDFPVQPVFNGGGTMTEDYIFGKNAYYLPAAVTIDSRSNIRIICTDKPYSGTDTNLLTYASILSTAAQITINGSNPVTENVTVTNMFLLPWQIVSFYGGVTGDVTVENQNQVSLLNCAILRATSMPTQQNIFPISWNATANNLPTGAKCFLKTPKQMIEIGEVYSNGVLPRISIHFAYGDGADSPEIILYHGNNMVDITDDFTVSFAVNEEALRQSQQKELYALNAAANVVGGVGGVVGGVASGNYFGAVQSAVGAVNGVASMYAGAKLPANMKGSGDAISALYGGAVMSFIYVTPINSDDVSQGISNFGYVYITEPIYNFSGEDISSDDFFRMSQCDIYDMTGGEGAKRDIASAFLQGVKFKSL